jgi:hypothetical protein
MTTKRNGGDERTRTYLSGLISGALGAACDVAPKMEQSDLVAILGGCVALCRQRLPGSPEKVVRWVMSIVQDAVEEMKADPNPNVKKSWGCCLRCRWRCPPTRSRASGGPVNYREHLGHQPHQRAGRAAAAAARGAALNADNVLATYPASKALPNLRRAVQSLQVAWAKRAAAWDALPPPTPPAEPENL